MVNMKFQSHQPFHTFSPKGSYHSWISGRRKLGKERVPERVLPGRSSSFSFCLSSSLSQTGLRFRDCNHIVEFVFVDFVFATYRLRSKKTRKGKSPEKGGNRFWKSIVLGFKTPREAIKDHGFSTCFPSSSSSFERIGFPVCREADTQSLTSTIVVH
ncbi:uncharacterized protein LOC114372668 [Glycine soja]|uniref:uncharacterized protein LOC114372668 n=1 Tax=Glycine soja TaxID=3848 RepID=UPI00103DD636|nr:uncharacterized protein LOC114372668 [Glycine soja]